MPQRETQLQIAIKHVVLVFAAYCAVITLLGGVAQALMIWANDLPGVDTLHDLFWVDGDRDIWTWTASLTLLMCAVLLFIHAAADRTQRRSRMWYWLGLAVLFILLSIDDVAMIHERSERALGDEGTGVFYFKWTMLAIPLVIIIGLVYLRFVFSLPSWVRNQILLAGALAVGGAVGLEMLSSWIAYHWGDGLAYRANTFVEECVEQAGLIVFLHVLLQYLAAQQVTINVQFKHAIAGIEITAAEDQSQMAPASNASSSPAVTSPQTAAVATAQATRSPQA